MPSLAAPLGREVRRGKVHRGAGGVLNAPARAHGTGPVSAAWLVNNAGVGGAAYAPDLGAGWFPFRRRPVGYGGHIRCW